VGSLRTLLAGRALNGMRSSDLSLGKELIIAIDNGEAEDCILEILRRGANPNLYLQNTMPFISRASEYGYLDVVNFCLDAGVDVNQRDKTAEKGTPLMWATSFNRDLVTQLLLIRGADPNLFDSDGRTALFDAVTGGYPHIVKILLYHGANPDIRDTDGKTVLWYARRYHYHETVKILLSYGANE
jgi:uncharacterized protein